MGGGEGGLVVSGGMVDWANVGGRVGGLVGGRVGGLVGRVVGGGGVTKIRSVGGRVTGMVGGRVGGRVGDAPWHHAQNANSLGEVRRKGKTEDTVTFLVAVCSG